MSRPILRSLAALSLLALTAAAGAVPIGGGTTLIYVGQAAFVNNGYAGVSASTYAACAASLQAAINYRVQNWGWVVSSITPCHASKYLGPPFTQLVTEGPGLSDRQVSSVLKADADLRAKYNIDAFEAEQDKLFSQPADGGGIR